MSKVNKLDLSGINIAKLTTKRTGRPGIKPNFTIPVDTQSTSSSSCCSTKILFGVVIVLLTIFIIIRVANTSSTASTYVKTEPFKQLTPSLRKIIKMKCAHDTNTHCTTQYENGEYVVNIGNCMVYDFNGIPFTDVFKDGQNNWHVPPSSDMTLIVNKACKELTATYDTQTKYKTNYAKKNADGKFIKKIVWIPTSDCYKEFDLKIGQHNILEGTPSNMIQQQVMNNVNAFTYNVEGSISGSISISGTGCDVPIHVYSLKT